MKIELPQVGESVTEGIIGRWLKQVGDHVEKYEPLVEVVTDKVNMEMPSPVSGVLTEIIVAEGTTVPMGAVIADITVEGEAPAPETLAEKPAETAATPVSAPEPAEIDRTGVLMKNVAPVGPTGSGGPISNPEQQVSESPGADTTTRRRRYSPVVLRLAEEHDIDLDKITGTGIGGRVTRKDVQSYIASPAVVATTTAGEPAAAPAPSEAATTPAAATTSGASTDEERVSLLPVRRMIAANMVRSATEIPEAWSIVEVDVTNLVQRRESLKVEFQRTEGMNITYLPFVIKAVAESLKENPLLNSSWDGDAIILKKRINIGIAIAAPNGLVVPSIHDADTLSIAGIAKRIDDLTSRAREGKLTLDDVQGGTFTVNNTGALGSVVSKPIINYPQAAILTTETIIKRPIVINDAIAIRSMMNITLTFDHRIMDGAESSAFINAVKRRLESIGPDTGIY